jgi:hypothetical protein
LVGRQGTRENRKTWKERYDGGRGQRRKEEKNGEKKVVRL